jgi:hypothetical protein
MLINKKTSIVQPNSPVRLIVTGTTHKVCDLKIQMGDKNYGEFSKELGRNYLPTVTATLIGHPDLK